MRETVRRQWSRNKGKTKIIQKEGRGRTHHQKRVREQ